MRAKGRAAHFYVIQLLAPASAPKRRKGDAAQLSGEQEAAHLSLT